MKRIFCALLAAAMLLLPCMALADVILEPEDSFYKRHSDQCAYQAGRTYIAEGEGGSAPVYGAPDRGELRRLSNGEETVCQWLYTDGNGAQWALISDGSGWINLYDFKVKYDWVEFEREHKDEIKHEDAEVDAAKGAGDTIIFYDYPGSERKAFDLSLGAFGSDKITVDTTYTDGEGRRWGFIGYWYGYRNLWISLDDPTVEVPPAAEQPAPVSTGVCTSEKRRPRKKSCTAKPASERMRNMAPYLLVRGRRWAMVRKNSSECRFFCRGKLSGSARPYTSTCCARTSHFCPLPGEGTSSPVTRTAAPVAASPRPSWAGVPVSTMHCMLVRQEPSLISTKLKSLASRRVRIQPHRAMAGCAASELRASIIRVRCMAGLLGGKRICASVALPGDGLKSVCAGRARPHRRACGWCTVGVRRECARYAPDVRLACGGYWRMFHRWTVFRAPPVEHS